MAKSVLGLFGPTTDIDSVVRDLERIGVPKRHVHTLGRAAAGEERSWTDRVAAFFGFTGDERERELGAAYADAMNAGDTLVIADVEDAMADRTAAVMNQYGAIDLAGRTKARMERERAGATPINKAAMAAAAATASMASTPSVVPPAPESRTIPITEQTTIPVIQEELEISKRVVERGGVRVHSHVEEMTVEEVIRLREEHVDVERRTVNRPVTTADAFKETTIEVKETAEQPVVRKVARVVEEVVIGKKSEEHEEKVAETVRRQDVDVEPLPKTGTGGGR